MPHEQRAVAVFRWDEKLPDFDDEIDPERYTALIAHAPAQAILTALRALGYHADDETPNQDETLWYFTVDIGGQGFSVYTMWTGIDDQDYFAVQLCLDRGLLAALFRRPVTDERLEPVCCALDQAFASIPRVIDLRWLTDEQFAASYNRGEPLPPADRRHE